MKRDDFETLADFAAKIYRAGAFTGSPIPPELPQIWVDFRNEDAEIVDWFISHLTDPPKTAFFSRELAEILALAVDRTITVGASSIEIRWFFYYSYDASDAYSIINKSRKQAKKNLREDIN